LSFILFDDSWFCGSSIRSDVIIEQSSGIGTITSSVGDFEIHRESHNLSRFQSTLPNGTAKFDVFVDFYDPFVNTFYFSDRDVVVPFLFLMERDVRDLVPPKDFVFLIDRSKSMVKMTDVINRCMVRAISQLLVGSRIEIIDFGEKCSPLFGKLMTLNDETRQRCIDSVSRSRSSMNESNLLQGIGTACSEFDNPRIPKSIVILSDCCISRTEETLSAISDARSLCTFWVINVGSSSGFGSSGLNITSISARDGEAVMKALTTIAESASIPVVVNPHIGENRFQCISAGNMTLICFDSFPGIEKKKSLLLRGTVDGQMFKATIMRKTCATGIALDVFRDFFEMKRRNFISSDHKLLGDVEVSVVPRGLQQSHGQGRTKKKHTKRSLMPFKRPR
jgi:hypothetical protein